MAGAHSAHGHGHEHGHGHGHSHDEHHGHAEHGHTNYVKIWAILLGLLVVSVIGPLFGHPVITLITAFGIAIVKAYLVAKNFMHLNLEKRYIIYMMTTCLVFMLLFFAGAAPDVMKEHGANVDGAPQWAKPHYHVQIPVEGGRPEGQGEHEGH